MSRDHIENAMRDGIPFVTNMADGEKYEVTNRYQIAVGKAHVVVMDKRDLPHVLPMLTMTGISSLNASSRFLELG